MSGSSLANLSLFARTFEPRCLLGIDFSAASQFRQSEHERERSPETKGRGILPRNLIVAPLWLSSMHICVAVLCITWSTVQHPSPMRYDLSPSPHRSIHVQEEREKGESLLHNNAEDAINKNAGEVHCVRNP